MEAIFKRRSVRRYSGKHVTDEEITLLLKAAMQAPSASNQQPWEFVVLRDQAVMKAVKDFQPYSGMLEKASAAIVVCGNTKRAVDEDGYWVQDCSAATQNILLQATQMGLGSCWLGIYPTKESVAGLCRLLHLPVHVVPLCIVSLGYPAREPAPKDAYKPERVHIGQWQEREE